MWQCEDHVHYGIQQFLFAGSEPLVTCVALALGAMTVATGVVRDRLMSAARTLIQVSAQRRCSTALDGA